MYRRLYRFASPLILLLASGGCVQATRHSNTMLFGTNTVVGLRVGTNVGQVPSVDFGYTRQEAVVMPLLANTREHADPTFNRLSPCDVESPLEATASGRPPIHPCLFVGLNGDAMDTYSVLGTFGADFSGEAQGPTGTEGRATASGGLAQYFATGIAAQILALTGGAALVATGRAAEASATASASTNTRQTIEALYGNDTAFDIGETSIFPSYESFRDNLIARVRLTSPDRLQARITAFEMAAGATVSIANRCTAVATCVTAIERDAYLGEYQDRRAALEQALTAWVP